MNEDRAEVTPAEIAADLIPEQDGGELIVVCYAMGDGLDMSVRWDPEFAPGDSMGSLEMAAGAIAMLHCQGLELAKRLAADSGIELSVIADKIQESMNRLARAQEDPFSASGFSATFKRKD